MNYFNPVSKRMARIMTSTDLKKISNKSHEKAGIYLEHRTLTISNGRRYIDIHLTAVEQRELGCQLIKNSYTN